MIGQRVSHYQVLEELGAGGMGVVYKARDEELNRLVALKALPGDKTMDAERRARFLQEARVASALNHPNIVTIHDVLHHEDRDLIVMELVTGTTLDRLIPRGGMRLGEALKCAVQVASALEAAHGAGIVHRDLKPGNVMVDDQGRVRVLDFGLAKLVAPPEGPEAGATRTRESPASPQTRDGQILGTVAYMSPEQAEGRTVDARSDIFSFGAVLYEMVTGRHAFQGSSTVSTMAAILKEEPAPLPAEVPHDLERLIQRCLRKDSNRRPLHMADVRLALEDLKEESDSGKVDGRAPVETKPHRFWPWLLPLTLAVSAGVGAAWWRWSSQKTGESQEAFREIPFTSDPGHEFGGTFSPDGSAVVFARFPAGQGMPQPSIEMKMVDAEGTLVLKPGSLPTFSPDGKWIAYYGGGPRGAEIRLVSRIGGPERRIADVAIMTFPDRFVSWMPDGKWLASQDRDGEAGPYHIALVSVETGEKRSLTSPAASLMGDSGPALSPDGRTLAFTRHSVWGASDLYLLPLDSDHRPAGEPRRLTTHVPNANCAAWTPDGREVVFCSRIFHAATLWRARVDGSAPPRPLAIGGRGAYYPDVARTGNRMIYAKHIWDLNVWAVELLPSGLPARPPEALIHSNLLDEAAAFSPDGSKIAFASERSGARQIWLSDATGDNLRQLTSMESVWNMEPRWSPDGESIAFDAEASGNLDVYVLSVRDVVARRLTSDPGNDGNPRWSRDGGWIYFESDRGGSHGVWKVPKEGGDAIPAGFREVGPEDPEGAFRYLVRETEAGLSIWREPTGGGEAKMIVERAATHGLAVTRRGVYFVAPGPENSAGRASIAFREFGSDKTTKITDLKPGSRSGERLAVSPDGRRLLYTQCDQEGDDLVLVENFR